MKSRAFTLIELLVVISIIGLLSSVVLASLNTAREKARIAAGKGLAGNIDRVAGDSAVGMWDFDECSGLAIDRSLNGNTGSLTNTPTYVPSDTPTGLGCSMSFNGSNQQVSVPDAASMNFSGDVTMSVWIKPTSVGGGNYRTIMAKRNPQTAYEIYLNNASGFLGFYNGSLFNSTYIPSLNVWTHVAAVVNSSGLKLYADGKEVYSNPTPTSVTAYSGLTFAIGSANTGGEYFAGQMDSVHVFSKSLTASEIRDMYLAESGEHQNLAILP